MNQKKYHILFPSNYFNKKEADPEYQEEYIEAKRHGYQVVLFNYDEYVMNGKLSLYPKEFQQGIYIYRGWMLKSPDYNKLYSKLNENGIQLINNPEKYKSCHEFPYSYKILKDLTPKILIYKENEKINWDYVKSTFHKFMIKDFVKSVKETNFPIYFDQSYSNSALDDFINKFKEMRGELFSEGIVIKEFVHLKKYNGKTKEYRLFYLNKKLINIFPQDIYEDNSIPVEFISLIPLLNSNFYTVDIAEKEDGFWIIIETGDGQVSGLPEYKYVKEFYEHMKG